GADNRIDVLKEHDPGCDLMRPVDDLRLGLMLAIVARGMKELFRDDRRPQSTIRQRHTLPIGPRRYRRRILTGLKQLPHRRDPIHHHDPITDQRPAPRPVIRVRERNQLHRTVPVVSWSIAALANPSRGAPATRTPESPPASPLTLTPFPQPKLQRPFSIRLLF